MTSSDQNGTARRPPSTKKPRAGKPSAPGKKPAAPRAASGNASSDRKKASAADQKPDQKTAEPTTKPPATGEELPEARAEAPAAEAPARAADTAAPAAEPAAPAAETAAPAAESPAPAAPTAGTPAPAAETAAPVACEDTPPARTEARTAPEVTPAAREETHPGADHAPESSAEAAAAAGETATPRPGWRDLLRPRAKATHVLVAVLCAALGFGVVTQIRQTHDDALSGMRQDDLVRLLDELTRRNHELDQEQEQLRSDLAELRSSTSSREAAAKAAAEQARVQGVLAGTLPVQGSGVRVMIQDPSGEVRAQNLLKILEELRNSGAEAVELSGQRLTASSWMLDASGAGVVVDGTTVRPPYEWTAIGDPHTISVALDIPGGALASVRNAGGKAQLTESDDLEITAVRELEAPKHATPVPSKDDE